MKKFKILGSVLLALILMTGSLAASVIGGTRFSPALEAGENRLHLRGTALLRVMIFVEAYAGAFYLPREIAGAQALEDVAKHLELEYRVAISAEDFARATTEKIRDGVDADQFQRLRPGIEALNRLYRDVDPGDRYALTYVPGAGTRLTYNGETLGTIAGADFARALFGIWIGDNPIDKGFRNKLLGKG